MLAFLDKIPFGTPRLRRIAFWLLTTAIAYTLIGFFVIPPVLKSVVISQVDSFMKRQARIERVYFNPFSLHLEVEGLQIHKREGDGNLVSIRYMDAAPGIATIWELAPVVSYLHLDGVEVDVTFFGDGKYSISDLLGTPEKPKEAPQEEEGTVFPFALYGFELTNSTIIFDDRSHEKRHVISDINLRVPFTSSIMDKRKEFTQPKLTAVVNGDPVELDGRTLPFDETLLTEFELGAVNIDLDQYWSYVPIETPLQLESGTFTSDLSLYFERPNAQSINLFLGGGGSLIDLKLSDPKENTVLSLKELSFAMERFSLGDNALILTRVALEQPFFKVIRDKGNTINWATYFPVAGVDEAGPKLKTAGSDTNAFALDIREAVVNSGSVEWIDRQVSGGFEHTFKNLNVRLAELSTTGERPSAFQAYLQTNGALEAKGAFTLKPLASNFTLSGAKIPLSLYQPYLAEAQPMIVESGMTAFSADVDFKMDKDTPLITVANGSFSLTDFSARKPDSKDSSIGVAALTVSRASVDIKGETVAVDEIKLAGPTVKIVREKDGRHDLEKLFIKESEAVVEADAPEPKETWAGGWHVSLKRFQMEEGNVAYSDLSLANPANLNVSKLAFTLEGLSTDAEQSMPYTLSGAWGGQGGFALDGGVSVEPLRSEGRLRVNGMGLRPFDSYLAEHADLLIARGVAYANLKYTFQGGETPRFAVIGDTALNSIRVKGSKGTGEIASVDTFDIKGIRFSNGPYRLTINEIALNGPRADIEIYKNGQMNIKRALRMPEPEPPAKDEETDKKSEKEGEKEASKEEAPKPTVEESLFQTLTIDKISMANGSVHYRDRSVTPHFETTLSKMTLLLTDVDQAPDSRPKVDFKANIGPTPMSVTGVLNPVVTPIYSDLAIAVNGMELIPLTPYTLKHLAYPIQKGRLYADVTFKTEDWELNAENKFFIEQLEVGEQDDRPDAPNVPVEFGLSLLQDGNGDMEINLPIRGRLDDPDFKIGGIVFKAIISLFFKALASPFSLIGSMFGGGEDMDFVVFEPGRIALDDAGKAKLATMVKALNERDQLRLEVDGVVDKAADTTGLIQVIFENKIKQQKWESLSRDEQAETAVADVVVSPEEYEEFLFEAYADEPDENDERPTTLFMVDEQPVPVMEKFIRDRIVITDADLRELALRRAKAVKEYIIAQSPELADRVFLLDKQEEGGGKTGVPRHRADLGIK